MSKNSTLSNLFELKFLFFIIIFPFALFFLLRNINFNNKNEDKFYGFNLLFSKSEYIRIYNIESEDSYLANADGDNIFELRDINYTSTNTIDRAKVIWYKDVYNFNIKNDAGVDTLSSDILFYHTNNAFELFYNGKYDILSQYRLDSTYQYKGFFYIPNP